MKIFGKVLVNVGAIIAVLLLAIGIILFQGLRILSQMELSRDIGRLIHGWDLIQISAGGLLGSPEPLAESEVRWQRERAAFEARLGTLVADDGLMLFGAEVRDQVLNTKNLWSQTKTSFNNVDSTLEAFKKNVLPLFPELARGQTEGLQGGVARLVNEDRIDHRGAYYYKTLTAALRNVNHSNSTFMELLAAMETAMDRDVRDSIRTTAWIIALLALVSVPSVLVYTFLFSRRISRRAGSIERSLRRVAERDFTVPPPDLGTDEIGLLAVHLRDLIGSLGSFFASVKTAASSVTELKDSLSAGTAETAAAVQQINTNIARIQDRFRVLDTAIEQVASALDDIGAYLSGFKDDAERQTSAMQVAGADLNRTVEEIRLIADRLADRARGAETLKRVVIDSSEQMQSTNQIIKTVSRDIRSIAEIIEIIDQISEQTNILSLNAAIESAHAGSAGAGFAVVADEIRKLADSTQENAQRIAEALSAITEKVETAREAGDTSSAALEIVSADVHDFTAALTRIAEDVAAASARSVQVGTAISESMETTRRVGTGTAEMYQRHRAIDAAMRNIKSISDEAVSGIAEVDQGSREIMAGITRVETLSLRSKQGAAALEAALAGFKIEGCVDSDLMASDYDERGVAVKRPPQSI